jgi:hypothetical protein
MNHRARMAPPRAVDAEQRDYLAAWTTSSSAPSASTSPTSSSAACRRRCTPPRRACCCSTRPRTSAASSSRSPRWSAHTETTVIVADPDQAIYAWRGADPAAFAALPLAGTRVLEQSYRVPAPCTPLADRWLAQLGDRRSGAAYQPTDQRRRAPAATRDAAPPRAAARRDRADLAARGETCMLLTSCGYMLAPSSPSCATAASRSTTRTAPRRALEPAARRQPPARLPAPVPARLGRQARAWTWDDLRLWTEPLSRARRARPRRQGAHRGQVRADQFGESQADSSPPRRRRDLLGTTSIDHPALRGDVDWWAACCAPTSAPSSPTRSKCSAPHGPPRCASGRADHRHDPQRQGRRGRQRLRLPRPLARRRLRRLAPRRPGPRPDRPHVLRRAHVALTRARARRDRARPVRARARRARPRTPRRRPSSPAARPPRAARRRLSPRPRSCCRCDCLGHDAAGPGQS